MFSTMTEWDKIRSMLTQEEYKNWVERGVWPKRLQSHKDAYIKRLNARRKANRAAQQDD